MSVWPGKRLSSEFIFGPGELREKKKEKRKKVE